MCFTMCYGSNAEKDCAGEAVRLRSSDSKEHEDRGRSPQGVQALTRGISLLDFVANATKPLRFSEVVEGTGLTKATAHRMLGALIEARLLQFDARNQTYRLGVRLFEMAHRVWDSFDLRSAAEPELERLRDLADEAVRIAVLNGEKVLYIDQREAMHPVRLGNGVGNRVASHASSAGKAILAHLEPATRERLLASMALHSFTPNTITSPEALRAELVLTKARGYAVSMEEQSAGVNSVAAPILDHRSRPLGAICLLGPAFRLSSDKLHTLGREVIEAARRISGNAGQSFMSINITERPSAIGRDDVQCAVPASAYLGEGPCWCPEHGRLYWVDILAPAIHVSDVSTGLTEIRSMPELVSAIAPRRRGGFVVATQGGIKAVDLATGSTSLLAAPESDGPGNRLNDAKCDSRGRFWVGSMALDASPDRGKLYRLDPDGKVHVMGRRVHVSNGLGWSPDDKIFYFVDSGRATIWAYDFDVESGTIENRRTFVVVPQNQGNPDGLTVDSEGYVWVAHWDGWRITRYAPDGGVDRIVNLPVPRPTSCTFGGPDMKTLFVTTARIRLSAQQLAEAPLSGSVLAVSVGIRGLSDHTYGG